MLLNSAVLVASACELYLHVHGTAEKRELDNLVRACMDFEARQAQNINKIIQDRSLIAQAKKAEDKASEKTARTQLHQDIVRYKKSSTKEYKEFKTQIDALKKKLVDLEDELKAEADENADLFSEEEDKEEGKEKDKEEKEEKKSFSRYSRYLSRMRY